MARRKGKKKLSSTFSGSSCIIATLTFFWWCCYLFACISLYFLNRLDAFYKDNWIIAKRYKKKPQTMRQRSKNRKYEWKQVWGWFKIYITYGLTYLLTMGCVDLSLHFPTTQGQDRSTLSDMSHSTTKEESDVELALSHTVMQGHGKKHSGRHTNNDKIVASLQSDVPPGFLLKKQMSPHPRCHPQ